MRGNVMIGRQLVNSTVPSRDKMSEYVEIVAKGPNGKTGG